MGLGGAGRQGVAGLKVARLRVGGVWVALLALVATTFLGPAGAAAPDEGQAGAEVAGPVGAAVTAPVTDAELAAASQGAPFSRLAGSDRYGSAVAISRHRYADPSAAGVVYLANGWEFSDALTAGTLSDGPVLLVRPDCGAVPRVVLDEIDRIGPAQVVALGGPAAVCDAALQEAAGGRATDRIGGETRYETAALIAQRQFPSGSERVYLTRGDVSPDALGGGMLKDGPILLAARDGGSVPPATAATVAAMGATTVVALGGPAAVSDAALAAAADGRATARLAGSNRYGTAIAIAKHAYPSRTARVYLARGDQGNFADAVAAGMLTDGPVVLTPGPCSRVLRSTAAFLTERHPSRVVGLGGEAALCTSTLRGASIASRPAVDCAVVSCVALTFDDGPGRYTGTLLNTLATYRVPVTFFQVGEMVDAYGRYSRRAHVEGHEVANHTWNHPQLPYLSRSAQQSQVDRTDNELNQHDVPDTRLLRPPYGAYDSDTRRLGFPLVIWDVDPRDWEGPSTSVIYSRIMNNVRRGSIVLQHDIHPNSVDAVPAIVRDLLARGYTLVTVSELAPDLRAGDVIFRQGNIVRAGASVSSDGTIVLDDGTVLGPFVDGAGVPGVAPPLQELLQEQPRD